VTKEAITRFAGFALVGCAGFLVDAGALYLALPILGPYYGRAISFLCAVTATYALNRQFVFAEEARALGWARGWVKFVIANAAGACVNLLVYGALLPSIGPFLALAAGSIAGLAFNFTLSALFVFRAK
jgi:putative flippase GtrA